MKIRDLVLSEKYFLFILFFIALLIRLAYVIPLHPDKLSPDSYDWMNIAMNVASGNGYQDTWRPPGYATFLGIIFFFFGKSIIIARIINSILSSITCIIVYFIGKKIFSSAVGKISAILLCFYPYMIAYAGDLLSETFLTFMISLSVLFILITSENPRLMNIIITGIILGLTSLTKSTILPFFFTACVWIWWQTKSFKVGFLVGIFIIITISGWTLRNHFYYKDFIPISTPWLTAYGSSCDEALYQESRGEFDTPQTDEMNSPAIPKDWNDILKLPRIEQDRICKQKTLDWLKQNPDKFFWLVKKRLVHFWRLYPMMAYKWQKITAMFTSGIYIPLCFLGIILSIKKIKKTSLLIFLFISYTLTHVFFVVVLRYRIPIDPYIIVFASFALYTLLLSKVIPANEYKN